jgi:hypothetical protein
VRGGVEQLAPKAHGRYFNWPLCDEYKLLLLKASNLSLQEAVFKEA